ncbi:retrovirus-related pol polyprotein from transposon TNT 1-94 [Tanacetum coccineum]
MKQQYGNFKAEGLETLEQTFNRLQAIVSHLEFMDVPIEQDDLNQKFVTSLAPEWLVYTIVWRNRDDLDTMSLDDVYNHLKVYEPKFPLLALMSVCSFIATQPNGSQIKYEDITQIDDDDDIEEIDIKWNLALLSMRADRFWKKTGKKITIQRSDVAGFDKSKVECFNCHKMGHFARECRSPRSQDKGKRESYKKDSKVEEPAPKAMIAIDGIGLDWSYMAEEDEVSNHALVADEEEVLTEYALMSKSSSSSDNEGNIDDKGYWDSGCSRHMTGNISHLSEYEPYDGRIMCHWTCEVKDLLVDDSYVLLRTPRQHNMYSIDLNNIVPHKNLTSLIAKASVDESPELPASPTVETVVPTVSTPIPTGSKSFPPITSILSIFMFLVSRRIPKKIVDALKDESWVEAMQEELLQFQIQNV